MDPLYGAHGIHFTVLFSTEISKEKGSKSKQKKPRKEIIYYYVEQSNQFVISTNDLPRVSCSVCKDDNQIILSIIDDENSLITLHIFICHAICICCSLIFIYFFFLRRVLLYVFYRVFATRGTNKYFRRVTPRDIKNETIFSEGDCRSTEMYIFR